MTISDTYIVFELQNEVIDVERSEEEKKNDSLAALLNKTRIELQVERPSINLWPKSLTFP